MSKTTFTANGHTYKLAYDLPAIREIRDRMGVNLLTNEGVSKVASDLLDFAEMLWHSVRVQAERQGVDESTFIKDITPIVDKCVDCWLEASSDFFEHIGRSALASVARSLIDIDRAERADLNQVVTREVAEQITQAQSRSGAAQRRRKVAEIIGDSPALGPPSDS